MEENGQSIDLRLIWHSQGLPEQLVDVLDQYGEAMHMHLLSPPAGGSNPTEWAKKKACVEAAMKIDLEFRNDISEFLIGKAERRQREVDGRRDQRLLNGIQAQAAVAEIGSVEWQALRQWARTSGMRLSHSEDGILEAATRLRSRPLTEAQSIKAMDVMERAKEQGYRSPS